MCRCVFVSFISYVCVSLCVGACACKAVCVCVYAYANGFL